jgi:purine-binding chemotaxis protein CheW
MTTIGQVCTFFLGDLHCGVDVLAVQEVIRSQTMTPVPLASRFVGGLMNLRGQIVLAIDLRRRLGLPERASGRPPMIVVVRTQDGPVGLLVDDIGEVHEVHEDAFEPPPATLDAAARSLIRGAYKLESKLLHVLDVDEAVHISAAAVSHAHSLRRES